MSAPPSPTPTPPPPPDIAVPGSPPAPPPPPPPIVTDTAPNSLNSGYGSGDETVSLLTHASAPKPVLTRQDCASFPLSEDGARSVPDLEMHCRPRLPPPPRCRCEMMQPPPARSASRESVRIPLPVLLNASPCSARVIRQSSQPEPAGTALCGGHCGHHASASASLRQLREPGDGIAGIAADSLRINGAIRQFKQVTAA